MEFFRYLNHLDLLVNTLVLLISLAIGSLSTVVIVFNQLDVYVVLTTVSTFILSVWLIIRLVPFSLLFKLIVDTILKVFCLATCAIYLFHQYHSKFNSSVSILCVVDIILIVVTLMSGLVLYNVKSTGLESDIEKQPSTSSSSKSSTTKMSGEEYKKNESMDYDNWMNVHPQPAFDNLTLHNTGSLPNIKQPEKAHPANMDQTDFDQATFDQSSFNNQPSSFPQTQSQMPTQTIPKSDSTKSHETLIPNCNSDNSIHQHLEYDYVKRSKSTSNITSSTKRHDRLKSINDERVFLQKINESLLPSVLKTSESPILALKRQQHPEDETESINTVRNDAEYTREYNYHNKKGTDASAEKGTDVSEEKGTDVFEENDTEVASINLPYISEFGEANQPSANQLSGSQSCANGSLEFADFDQNTRVEYEKAIEEFKIPRTINKQWIQKTQSLNHISLDHWNQNETNYKNFRSRSGANLNIGISRIVSNGNLFHDSNLTLSDQFLMPLDSRADNIDSLSDVQSNTSEKDIPETTARPLFTHSNRSLSAPSLQTFRNISNGSGSSVILTPHETINRLATPPPFELDVVPVKSSPIRKLYQSPKKLYQSPKKLFRKSVDHDLTHKHSSSMISGQFSLYSSSSKLSGSPKRPRTHTQTKSIGSSHSRSRSASPKRSFKSLISRKPSTNQISRTPSKLMATPPALLKQAQVKKQITLDQETDFWDLSSKYSVENSRVSSVPSAIIGEYDREKWTTLKTLNDV